jgi:DNA-binding MarR family transcriptional regulator
MTQSKQVRAKTLVGDARAAIDICMGVNVRLASRRITRFLDARMAPSGLSIAQFGLMAHVAASTEGTIGALAGRCGLDQSTLSRNLRSLEQAGFVEIAVAERDLRARAVWLTEAGARRLEAALPVWREAHAMLSRMIAPEQVRALAAAAAALPDSVDGGAGARAAPLRRAPAAPRPRSSPPSASRT